MFFHDPHIVCFLGLAFGSGWMGGQSDGEAGMNISMTDCMNEPMALDISRSTCSRHWLPIIFGWLVPCL